MLLEGTDLNADKQERVNVVITKKVIFDHLNIWKIFANVKNSANNSTKY